MKKLILILLLLFIFVEINAQFNYSIKVFPKCINISQLNKSDYTLDIYEINNVFLDSLINTWVQSSDELKKGSVYVKVLVLEADKSQESTQININYYLQNNLPFKYSYGTYYSVGEKYAKRIDSTDIKYGLLRYNNEYIPFCSILCDTMFINKTDDQLFVKANYHDIWDIETLNQEDSNFQEDLIIENEDPVFIYDFIWKDLYKDGVFYKKEEALEIIDIENI